MVDTEIETISMSDTNLSHALLTDNEDLMTDYDRSLKSIGKHFTETIAPKGVAIINDKPTHWSAI